MRRARRRRLNLNSGTAAVAVPTVVREISFSR